MEGQFESHSKCWKRLLQNKVNRNVCGRAGQATNKLPVVENGYERFMHMHMSFLLGRPVWAYIMVMWQQAAVETVWYNRFTIA